MLPYQDKRHSCHPGNYKGCRSSVSGSWSKNKFQNRRSSQCSYHLEIPGVQDLCSRNCDQGPIYILCYLTQDQQGQTLKPKAEASLRSEPTGVYQGLVKESLFVTTQHSWFWWPWLVKSFLAQGWETSHITHLYKEKLNMITLSFYLITVIIFQSRVDICCDVLKS